VAEFLPTVAQVSASMLAIIGTVFATNSSRNRQDTIRAHDDLEKKLQLIYRNFEQYVSTDVKDWGSNERARVSSLKEKVTGQSLFDEKWLRELGEVVNECAPRLQDEGLRANLLGHLRTLQAVEGNIVEFRRNIWPSALYAQWGLMSVLAFLTIASLWGLIEFRWPPPVLNVALWPVLSIAIVGFQYYLYRSAFESLTPARTFRLRR
jgi:hypothetical protein